MQKSLGIAQPEEEVVLKDINARLSSHLQPHKDLNGFRKLILILSGSGESAEVHNFFRMAQIGSLKFLVILERRSIVKYCTLYVSLGDFDKLPSHVQWLCSDCAYPTLDASTYLRPHTNPDIQDLCLPEHLHIYSASLQESCLGCTLEMAGYYGL